MEQPNNTVFSQRPVVREIVWTRHARNRAYQRNSHPAVASNQLRTTVAALEKAGLWQPVVEYAQDERFALRVFPAHATYLLHYEADTATLSVITFGNTAGFWPRYGACVATVTDRNYVTVSRWTKGGPQKCGAAKVLGYL